MQKVLSCILFVFIGISNSSAQLTVTPGATGATLVSTILGTGVTSSNITVNGAPAASRGTFTCTGACNIGLTNGIILTSGNAAIAGQPNTGTGQGYDNGGTGDADLNTLTTGPTLDACVLEFDFSTASDTVTFNYTFASEEYSDYVGLQFNDVFGFFVSGPGITGQQNMALIPGTLTPVAINNANNGYAAPGIPPTGPCTNCTYYLDNTANTYTTAYDGMTTVLSVRIPTIPCETYHIKLAIADVVDRIYDSGVFIEANSFSSVGSVCLLVNGQTYCGDTAHICQGDSAVITAPAGPGLTWSTGDTTQTITVYQAGNYSCLYTNGPCFSYAVVTVVVDSLVPVPYITQSVDTLFCSLTSANYSYSWSLNGNVITGANTPQLIISQNGCYVVTVSDTGGCGIATDTLCVINLGITANDSGNQNMLAPNPFAEYTMLTFDNIAGENYTLIIIDVAARELRQITNIQSGAVRIEKENLKPGIYFYELKNSKGLCYKGKLMIR